MHQTTAEETKRGRGRPSVRQSTANKREIVKIANRDAMATHQEIADKVGVCRQTVSQTLAKYGINKQELEDYRENQADVLLGLQHRITKSISDDDIKKAPLRDKIVAAGILYDKHRLQTGQSTSNIASWTAIVARSSELAVKDSNPPVDISPSNTGDNSDS